MAANSSTLYVGATEMFPIAPIPGGGWFDGAPGTGGNGLLLVVQRVAGRVPSIVAALADRCRYSVLVQDLSGIAGDRASEGSEGVMAKLLLVRLASTSWLRDRETKVDKDKGVGGGGGGGIGISVRIGVLIFAKTWNSSARRRQLIGRGGNCPV
jgi:hypothetical protein